MNEYISREWLLAEYDRRHKGPPGGARAMIEEAPAADVRPVVRGTWEPTDIPNRPFPKWFRCSNCKIIFGDGITGAIAPEYGNRTWNFCPICSADMRKEDMDNAKL